MYQKEEKRIDPLEFKEGELNPIVGFGCLHYSVSEGVGNADIRIHKKKEGLKIRVGVRTRDGTAE